MDIATRDRVAKLQIHKYPFECHPACSPVEEVKEKRTKQSGNIESELSIKEEISNMVEKHLDFLIAKDAILMANKTRLGMQYGHTGASGSIERSCWHCCEEGCRPASRHTRPLSSSRGADMCSGLCEKGSRP
jgi:hypothetical protein